MARLLIWTGAILLVPVVKACGGMAGFFAVMLILYLLALPVMILVRRWRKPRGNEAWVFKFRTVEQALREADSSLP